LIVIDRSVVINQQSVNQLINQSVGNQTNQKPPCGLVLREHLEDLIKTLSLLEYKVKEVNKVFDYIKVKVPTALYLP
jgi:hypothetical protein